jgi:3-oxoacyl-[acyl-carrier protein] reductase
MSRRTVVVTGGSKGIGRAICLAFAAAGDRVFFNYGSDADAAAETERRAAATEGGAVGIQADVSDEAQVKDFLESVLESATRIDVLVNNAGITRDGLLVRMKTADWDDVFNVNLRGAFFCARLAAKAMLKRRAGRIVNISSVVGAAGNPGQANYVAAKAGLVGLTKAMAKELASRGITVNAVAPGFVETEMTDGLSQKAKDAMLESIPAGRSGTPEEVAAAVVFLASEEAAYITGQVMHVSGGMYM